MRREVITRRALPHWYRPGAMYFLTYRLADSLPVEVVNRLRLQREQLLKQPAPVGVSRQQHRANGHKIWFRDYDLALDRNKHVSWLADPRVAAMVRQNLYHHHGTKYYLLAYCIMSNHVHAVLQPLAEFEASDFDDIGEREDGRSPLSEIMHSLKSYTAHEANKIQRREGPFWQRESYDHWIRDEEELERIVQYIQANPVTAGLSQHSEDYFWCSCHDRFLADGEITGWLGWR